MTTCFTVLAMFEKLERYIREGRKALEDKSVSRCFASAYNIFKTIDNRINPDPRADGPMGQPFDLGILDDCYGILAAMNLAKKKNDLEGVYRELPKMHTLTELAMESHLSDTPLQA